MTRYDDVLKMSAMKLVAMNMLATKKLTQSATVAAALVLLGIAAVAKDQPTATLNFIVIRDYNGKPIRNASVVLHPVNKDGKTKGGLQLKTDADGKANYDGVPYGTLRVQALAQGFQTYGDDFEIDAPTKEITIKMKRPQGQYSVYEEHPENKKETPVPDAKPQ